MNNILENARTYRKAIIAAVPSLDDKTASTAPDMFPRLDGDGSLVKAGTRINWNSTVKKAATDLWDTEANNPDNAPLLWVDITYRDSYRIIPEIITVTEAFAKDECGWWGDTLYRSRVDNNVYTPAQYSLNWELANI
jgi:hypothetical protein